MERLTLNRRTKAGDKVECLPAGDGLPVWTTIPLDAKLPMMQNPKGSVILYTTSLGQPKHRCKQEHDFDLRDPNGKYICNEYHPLHDPHLKSYFCKDVMRRDLIKKGFISEDGRVLCSLREFNQYRQYLRHIFFLEIAKERKEELERRARGSSDDKAEVQRKPSRGTVIRRRLQQQHERDINDLRKSLNLKAERLEKRLRGIREDVIAREQKQREEAERRQLAVHKNQQEAAQRNLMMIKRWRHKDRLRKRLIEDREAQKKIQAEMHCLEKWNERKMSQKERLERQTQTLQQEDDFRIQSIANRDRMVNRQRENLQNKIEALKERTRERKRKRDELYAKRFEEKLATGDYRKWSRSREKRNKNRRTFNSTWSLKDVLNNLQVTDIKREEKADVTFATTEVTVQEVAKPDLDEDEELRNKAREIVDGVLEKVKNEIYPAYLKSIGEDDDPQSNDATPSKSVRFSADEDEIKADFAISVEIRYDSDFDINIVEVDDANQFRPVTEHILTPCASQLEVQKLEAEAILGSPEVGDKTSSVSFVETLLLRLLDDLNSGRLRKEDIMKLASYSMEIIQSTESESIKDATIMEEIELEGQLAASSSSSSLVAKKLVDFTLGKILSDIQSGNVHRDDLASLTVSLVDISGGGDEGSISMSISDADLDEYINETIRAATSSAMDPREDSPICEALLDNFMVNILKRLIKDLEEEVLTKDQIESLAKSVKDETKVLTEASGIDLKNVDDIRYVLLSLLTQLKNGDIDSQTLYQIVFAIVYSYSMIKSPPTPSYETKVTDLLKEVLTKAEDKASSGQLENVNTNIVHEANARLSHTNLDIIQIEKISSSIMTMSVQSEVICKTSTSDIARTIVEGALVKAKDQIENEYVDEGVLEGVENIAEAIINTLAPESQSPPLVTVFVDILGQLKERIEHSNAFDKELLEEFCSLIKRVKSHSIGPGEVADMAASVAEVVKNPPKSESSTTAVYVVKDTLKSIRDDFLKGQMEDDIIKEMIDIIHLSCRNLIATDPKSPALLSCLADFIRSILKLLSAKLQSGEFNQSDITELTEALKKSFEAKSTKCESDDDNFEQSLNKSQCTEVDNEIALLLRTDNVLDYLTYLVDNIETGDMKSDEIRDLGNKLIESGRTLMTSVSEKVSSINTNDAADGAVEDVLRTLKMEIDSGILTNNSLKEMTKSIIVSSSDSDFADELISGTIKSIERDVRRGYNIKDITSLPSLDHSPSASTVASYIVVQTIEDIRGYLSVRGMSKDMLGSVASSILSFLSDGKSDIGPLPVEFEQHKNTIVNVIACLRDDRISVTDAEKLFCVILEKYKDVLAGKYTERDDVAGLSSDDILLVENLVSETISHIQRSVEKGKIFDKEFSLPSAASSDDTSKVASQVVETCLKTIKDHIKEEDDSKPRRAMDIVDFVITIVDKLRTELSNGTISSLSMATFYRAISSEKGDLKALEVNALDNLSLILYDIEAHRSKSIYITRIIDTYLTPIQASSAEALIDPVKAVESILVSVSSEILTKFVKATLESLIMDMRDGPSSRGLEAESSVYVLRTTSSIVAESVIKKVISKIKDEIGNAMPDGKTRVNISNIERVASKLATSESQGNVMIENEKSKDKLQSASGHGTSITSKAAEDIVLETLHNIVSNLRLEQSLQSQDESQKVEESDSVASQEIHDYVLRTLQNIVTDLQDRRSLVDLGVLKTANTSETADVDLASKDSIMATTYVSEVLHNVLQDMKSEISTKASSSSTSGRAVKIKSPLDIEGSVIETLIKVLSGTTIDKHVSLLEDKQKDGVKKILTESIKKTIVNVKRGTFNQTQLLSMLEGLSKCVEVQDGHDAIGDNTHNLQSKVLSILLGLSTKMENLSVNEEMMNKLSSHLATVGMEAASESASLANDAPSNSSVASSEISDLVKDIISKISQQLHDEVNVHLEDNLDVDTTTDDTADDKKVTDKNFNRRNSASSSCPSTLNKDSSDTSSTSLTGTLPKRKDLNITKGSTKGTMSTATHDTKKRVNNYNRRSTEHKSDDKLLGRRSMPKPHINNVQGKTTSMAWNSAETGSSKVKKDTPLPVHYRPFRKSDSVIYPRSHRERGTYSLGPSSTPVRTTEIKPRLTNRPKLRSPDLSERSPVAQSEPQPEGPLELKSLCGVHKTRISYRNTNDNQSDSTTDDGSYTSELF